jgi:hypothetical protein
MNNQQAENLIKQNLLIISSYNSNVFMEMINKYEVHLEERRGRNKIIKSLQR